MDIGQSAIDLIKQFEGCRLTAYEDVAGIWTIGYGTASTSGIVNIYEGLTITEDQAEDYLKQQLQKTADEVNRLLTVPVTQNQFDALLDFAYNVGCGNLKSSTLLKLVNQGDYDNASNEFLKWDKAGGQVVSGLLRRRTAEQTLFNTPDDN